MNTDPKTGRFLKGFSGNPGGRLKYDPEVKQILKAKCPDAARKLCELVDCKDRRLAMTAITELFNRVYGKPFQMQEIEVSGGLDVRAQIRDMLLKKLSNNDNDNDDNNNTTINNDNTTSTINITDNDNDGTRTR